MGFDRRLVPQYFVKALDNPVKDSLRALPRLDTNPLFQNNKFLPPRIFQMIFAVEDEGLLPYVEDDNTKSAEKDGRETV